MPVAMPTRPRISTAAGLRVPDRRAQFEACADRLFGVVLVRLGITEQDKHLQDTWPQTLRGDQPFLRRSAETTDSLTQVFSGSMPPAPAATPTSSQDRAVS